ncbi:MAG TPA: rhomboid family intramembrane serine protease [Kiritimatiellia bacterium]|nr:rhomboid family intramembrane serine protease [Kiritimatiellia bacterium]HMO99281.1 rhomboid family intramembrane serine protease [Kiritimatiellia bacterium]
MREIGKIDNELDASTFRDYLFNQGIDAEIEATRSGAWSIWVHDEDRLEETAGLFARFQQNPQDQAFVAGAEGAEQRRAEREKEERKAARNLRGRDELFRAYGWMGIGHATLVLMVMSVLATLLIRFGEQQEIVQKLAIAETFSMPGRGSVYYTHLAEVRAGQIWRLITPAFMHFGLLHIVFNMLWLRDLGSMMERVRGLRFFLVFFLLSAAVSNVGQFYVSGPYFGGMSGVVYGLLGYAWMQSRYHPGSGFLLHPFTVQMMLIWFVVCLSGLIGQVANTAHAVGLAIGVAWGYLDARRHVP